MDSLFSDVDSLSESWSSEDQDDMNSLFGGQARSIFSSIEDTITKIDDFLLFERGFMQNDIVRMVSEQLGQTGKVVNLDLTVDLENIYGSKLQNVSAKNLQKMRLMSVGDYVVHGAWIGKVEKIVDSLTILFDDGTKCQLTVAGPEKIIAVSPDVIEDPQYPFYPGQRVKVESLSIKPTRWLCGRKDNPDEGTVCSVEAGLVYVEWLSCLFTNGEKGSSPDSLQNSKDLSLLSSFTPANWQLGDWCVHNGTPSSNFPEITVITKTKSKVDVQWQDGSQTFGLDSHLLFPVNVIDAHDFWPDMLVLEKVTVDDTQVGGSQRWGVVRSVDSKERTVKVKWQKSSSGGLGFEEEDMEEIVSAYELVEHPEFSYCLGEAVFRTDKRVADLEPAECGQSQIENVNNNLSSHIGIVVGFKDGKIEVKWATGTTSKVAPYEIRRVDNCEGATTTSVLPNETIQQSQEELPVKPNQLSGQKVQDVSDIHCGSTRDSNSYSLSEIAFGVLSSITSSLFGSVNTSLTGAYKVAAEEGEILDESPKEQVLELCSLTLDEQVPVLDDSEISVNKTSEKIKESNENMTLPSPNKHAESFKRFDMVSDCSDHHFVDGAGMRSTQVKTSWLKKVHREWGILEKDLPETMYVRVYEERMDLLRAAIVGAAGTPYHDNLFLFDIYLPQQYPNEPPMVYYNSGGLRVNPNLYESGKVCLSLLNTWTGSGSEVWNPECSTILQVLLSLQALVLNERPYFNEAGYDSQIGKAEGEKNSISYNENAFLVSCRSMLYLVRKPPKHFEGLVDEHFSERGRGILSACKAYMEGAPIGYPFSWEEADQQNPNSTGFKIMLGKLIPRLAEAFSEKGSMT